MVPVAAGMRPGLCRVCRHWPAVMEALIPGPVGIHTWTPVCRASATFLAGQGVETRPLVRMAHRARRLTEAVSHG